MSYHLLVMRNIFFCFYDEHIPYYFVLMLHFTP
uniref:Uncharacterized protein n=1 Tax=Arundo donax TaxID=35708 RepID=A0A0A9HM96_ARUDO